MSRRALDYAVPIAQRFGARSVAAHVVVPVPVTAPEMALMHGDLALEMRAAAARLDKHAKKLIPDRLRERSVVACGNAAFEILHLAEEIEADMIVLTTHGKTGWKRLLMGSTAERVAREAKCPVLTVRSSPAAQRRSVRRAK